MIEATELTFAYPGAPEPTLKGLTFSVKAGEVFGFLGPSGAGKSTTQKILYRLLRNYGGTVRVQDRDLRDWDSSLFAWTGIGFETPNLYSRLTGRENLRFAAALRRSIPERVTLDEAAERLGLTDAIDTPVETWSKGMRMRLAFIRAVLHRPSLLFLDEPTSGLDPFWARRVKDWVQDLRREGAAVFVTTHSMELADELCDSVGFLVDGELAACDSPTALKQRYGIRGITVTGFDRDGAQRTVNLAYEALLQGPVPLLSTITRVVNREVTLEQVFLAVTGRSLSDGDREPNGRLNEEPAPADRGAP